MDPLEIIDYLEKNVDHLEHDMDDPTGFWPHRCEDCVYFENEDCTLDCLRYRDLNLTDYIGLRIEEAR